MEPYIFGLVVVVVVAAILSTARRRKGRLGRAWSDAARRLDLTDVAFETAGGMRLHGRSGTRRVRFERVPRRGDGNRTRLVVQGAPGVGLRPETLGTALEKAVGIRELQIGDEAFDRDVHVQGLPEALRAVLDAETRSVLRELVRGWRVSVLDGEIGVELPSGAAEEPGHITALLKDLLDLAGRLDRPQDLALRIADNTRREPEWRVRLANVLLLLEKYPDHFAARETLERARSDEHSEVRLRAALSSGDEGLATLLEMASLRSADDSYAARAVLALGDQLPPESAEEILGRALRARQVQTAMACLDRLGRAGGPAIVALLAKVLAVEEGALGVAAARALGESGARAAEAPLLHALAHAPADVAATAADALGRMGSTEAVLPLKEAAEREGADKRLQRAVRQAVAEIQSRVHGASPGQLSVADAAAGQLSLAVDDAAGRVSIADRGGSR